LVVSKTSFKASQRSYGVSSTILLYLALFNLERDVFSRGKKFASLPLERGRMSEK